MTRDEWLEAKYTGEMHALKRTKKKFKEFIMWIDKDIDHCEEQRLKIREKEQSK